MLLQTHTRFHLILVALSFAYGLSACTNSSGGGITVLPTPSATPLATINPGLGQAPPAGSIGTATPTLTPTPTPTPTPSSTATMPTTNTATNSGTGTATATATNSATTTTTTTTTTTGTPPAFTTATGNICWPVAVAAGSAADDAASPADAAAAKQATSDWDRCTDSLATTWVILDPAAGTAP